LNGNDNVIALGVPLFHEAVYFSDGLMLIEGNKDGTLASNAE
jgi:hypothetical protein